MEDKKAFINIKNKGDACFKWCVVRTLNPVSRDAERVNELFREEAEELDWGGIEFPTPCSPKTFQTFEKTNEISICIFGLDKTNKIVPLYVSETPHPKTVRLFYQKGKEGGGQLAICLDL